MYRKILIATDGSELGDSAVEHGLQLAKALNANIMVVTVTEAWSPLDVANEAELGNFDAVKHYEDAAKRAAVAILKRATDTAQSIEVSAETRHVMDRPPAEGILETAKLEDCDLIVMASHGRRGLQKVLLGSQTSEVVTLSDRPVLVVR